MAENIQTKIDRILDGVPLAHKLLDIVAVVQYLEDTKKEMEKYTGDMRGKKEYRENEKIVQNIINQIISECFQAEALKCFAEKRFDRIQNMAITSII